MLYLGSVIVWGLADMVIVYAFLQLVELPRKIVIFESIAAALVFATAVIRTEAILICETLFVIVACIAYLNLRRG